jgi:hypothetical protein
LGTYYYFSSAYFHMKNTWISAQTLFFLG